MIGICKKHELIWSNNPFVLSRVEGRFFPLVSLSSSFDPSTRLRAQDERIFIR